jgi:hypothetical protein
VINSFSDFQMRYARESWKQERKSWRAVIHLNLVRCINIILDALQSEMNEAAPLSHFTSLRTSFQFKERHHILKLRLAPLRSVEKDLRKRLGAGADEEVAGFSSAPGLSPSKQELCVRSWKHVFERNHGAAANAKIVSDLNDAAEVIARCAEDMKSLWEDELVKALLVKRAVKLGDSADL